MKNIKDMKKTLFAICLLMVGIQTWAEDNYISLGTGTGAITYFNLLYKPSQNTKVYLVTRLNSDKSRHGCVFGQASTNTESYGISFNDNSDKMLAYTGGTNFAYNELCDISKNVKYYINYQIGSATVDVTPNATTHLASKYWAYAYNEGPKEYLSFGMRRGESTNTASPQDVFEIKISEGNRVLYHLVPAKQGGNYGFYDIRNGEFHDLALSTGSTTSGSGKVDVCKEHKYVKFSDDKTKVTCQICGTTLSTTEWAKSIKTDYGITTVAPYLDIQANTDNAGQQTMYVNTQSKFDALEIVDSATCLSVSSLKWTDLVMSKSVSLPSIDKKRTLYLIPHLQYVQMNGSAMDTVLLYAPVPVTMKPFHSISAINVVDSASVDDKTGLATHIPAIRWAVDYPDDTDLMDDDQFIVQRSYKSDFSDAEIVNSKSFSSIKTSKEEETVDGVKRKWLYLLDESEYAQFTTNHPDTSTVNTAPDGILTSDKLSTLERQILTGYYDYPDRRIYYRVMRAIVYGMWESGMGRFAKNSYSRTYNLLPTVTSVDVEKTQNWSNDKKVKVTVSLANPYPWEYNSLLDSTKVKSLYPDLKKVSRRYIWDTEDKTCIRVHRFSPATDHYEGVDDAIKDYVISGDKVKWDNAAKCWKATMEDCQSLPYLHYYYEAIVDTTGTKYALASGNQYIPSSETMANECYSATAASIANFTATRDSVKGKVLLEWELGSGLTGTLYLKRQDISTKEIMPLTVSNTQTSYTDTDVYPGHVYRYTLSDTLVYRGKTYTTSRSVLGWESFYGTLKGKARMKNGTGICNAVVRITRKDPIDIPDVYDEDGKLILKGIHEGLITQARQNEEIKPSKFDSVYVFETYTDEKGEWKLDSALYSSDAAKYVITVNYGGANFLYNGNQQSATIILSNSCCEYSDIDFICQEEATLKGRVLYDKSTVPVQDVKFELNGKPLYDASGKEVSTDQSGNFNITLPKVLIESLKVVKKGHTFKNGGYIRNASDEISYIPVDQNGMNIWDATKIRVVGRICGGGRQAEKQLGFAMSNNNLGDNLTMVLQLEGDNTANIVYLDNAPDSTVIKYNVHHPYATAKQKATNKCDSTIVSYEKKRIVIHPSAVTGEFFADLFPTKYKIIQLSAEGYSSLFADGEGFEILDLSNCITPKDSIIEMKGDAEGEVVPLSYTYNSIYKRVYHTPVTTTVTQFTYGRAVDYYGEQSVTEKNLKGEEKTMPLVNKGKYTFGYPYFEGGKRYTMQVRAHEDYYYNGSGQLERVYLDGGDLIVRNGLSNNMQDKTYTLDSLGTATIYVDADNAAFELSGEDALRQLNMSVKINGYYYEAEPIRGYVTGYRKKGEDVLCDAGLTVADVLRDPPGSKSFVYRESGTNYQWSREYDINVKLSLGITAKIGGGGSFYLGGWTGLMAGANAGTTGSTSMTGKISLTIPIVDHTTYYKGDYNLTLNERIQTSADELDEGAGSDLYVGTVNTVALSRLETISMIDSTTYSYCQNAIKKGGIHVISEGRDTNGHPYYLVIGEKIGAGIGTPRTFAYTQKYITGTLLPEYQAIIAKKLLYTKNSQDVQDIANAQQDVYYWSHVPSDDQHFGCKGYYTPLYPDGASTENFTQDEVQKCINMVQNWISAIYNNEKEKVDAYNKSSSEAVQKYSIAGAAVSHSENSSYYYKSDLLNNIFGANGGWNFGLGGDGLSYDPEKLKSDKLAGQQTSNQQGESISTNLPGLSLSFDFDPNFSVSNSGTFSGSANKTAASGYSLETCNNGYMDVDVYQDTLSVSTATEADWISKGASTGKRTSNYIFVARSGAARNPWVAPDSTLYYQPGTPMCAPMLKIDNPKIYVSAPVVNNQPGDEAATFSVRLTNETELTQNLTDLKPTNLVLYVEDKSNQKGAKLTMDGQALTSGRKFVLNPGESVEKTLEVRRGAKGYDYENIRLCFADESMTLIDSANISVHYLPTSTPLTIKIPDDKWVLNTLTEPDADGYYLPVEISGFSTKYDNFDHIALQYKKQTEGNSQWVTLCNWYNDSTYYNKANGVKQMFKDSETTLKYSFHGEKDPVEMKYDLRAVSYCRLGTGYVTRESNLASGTKDTRCPEVFGTPTPASGILTYEDVIQMNFTEPIAYNYLDETANFQVTGYTNNTDITTGNTLSFKGETNQQAITSVDRNLNSRSFSIDMLMQTATDKKDMTLFSHGNSLENMRFGTTADGCLCARINGVDFKSEPLSKYTIDPTKGLTHVGMIYRSEQQDVQFFAGTSIINNSAATAYNTVLYTANGKISLGNDIDELDRLPFEGKMLEVRLWSTELTDATIAKFNKKHLSGYENQLIAHWPMTEMQGTIVNDDAHGAGLTLTSNITWDNVDGYSLQTNDKEPVAMLDAQTLSTSSDNDYTLTFWFQTNKTILPNQAIKDSIAVFSVGDSHLPEVGNGRMFIGFKGTNLELVSNGNVFNLGEAQQYANQMWHHFCMTVNRSTQQFAAFLDSKLVVQDDASKIDGLASDYAALGDTAMTMHFDVLTEWDFAMPSSLIKDVYNTRFSGKEMGLHVYLPFTRYEKNDQGIYGPRPCDLNCIYNKNSNGDYVISTKRIVTSGFNTVQNDNAPLREHAELEKLDFSWSSTGTALQVNINTEDKVINKQNIFVTIRGVEDNCGNVMKSPKMLMYYVDKNVLRWENKTIDVECDEGVADTLSLSWKNISGKRLSYTIDNVPSWMTLTDIMGTAEPQDEQTIRAVIDAGLAAGTYSQGIYLTDENGLSDCVTLNVTIKPTACEWTVDKTHYDRTMNLRAEVQVKNCNSDYVIDDDTSDKVGAFIENDCVGVANITTSGNSAYLFMTIYGDASMNQSNYDKTITFLLWDSQTGKVSELKNIVLNPSDSQAFGTIKNIEFLTNSVAGLPGDSIYHKDGTALIMRTTDKKEQSIYMNKGWNWISMYLSPEAINGINTVFINPSNKFSDDDIIKHVDFAQYSEKTRDWMGTLSKMDYKNVFQVYVNNAGNYRILGRELTDDELTLYIKGGSYGTGYWNDLPYLLSSSTTLEDAMTDFQIGEKAKAGDIIKSYDQFAVATVEGNSHQWVGTLKYMVPGKGYYLYHHGNSQSAEVDSVAFKYQRNTTSQTSFATTSISAQKVNEPEAKVFGKSEYSMPVIASFANREEYATDDRLCAYVAGEKVAEAQSVNVGDSTLLFINIPGEGGEKVTFALERDGEVIATTTGSITMTPTGIKGTLADPYVVDFDATVQKDGDEYKVYDLSGRRLPGTLKVQRRGMYVTGGKTVLK